MTKILIVTTSHAELGSTGKPTGVWLEELAVPYYAFEDAGASVTIASIAGGAVPIDPRSVEGEPPAGVKRFLADADATRAVSETPAIGALDVSGFDAIFLPGGHGTMWDLPESAELAARIGQAYDSGKTVAAVCHGPAGLVAAKRADGSPLVAGKQVCAFTNEEEEAAELTKEVPFLLETRLAELGAKIVRGPRFQSCAVRDGKLVTGQNPASSARVAELVLEVRAAVISFAAGRQLLRCTGAIARLPLRHCNRAAHRPRCGHAGNGAFTFRPGCARGRAAQRWRRQDGAGAAAAGT